MSDQDLSVMSGPSDFVTIQVAAGRCKVAERTVRRWVAAGRVRTRPGRRGILVAVEDLTRVAAESGQFEAESQDSPDSPVGGSDMPGTGRLGPDVSVIGDALRLVEKLQEENRNLAGQVGYYQAQVEQLREQLALPAPQPEPVATESTPAVEATPAPATRPWWRRFW